MLDKKLGNSKINVAQCKHAMEYNLGTKLILCTLNYQYK